MIRRLARSESHSEVHIERDGFRHRPAYRPIETDWQVCLNEVSLEKAVVLDGPAVVHQGGKSPRRGIYVERRSYSRPEAVSHTPHQTRMNSETGCPWPRRIYRWDQLEVEGGAAASLDGDSNRKSNRKLICQIVDGPAS